MNLAPDHDGSRNQFDDHMMAGQPMHSSASGVQFGNQGGNCMSNSPFDPTSQPGDDRGLDSIDSHHQLSSHQGVFPHAGCPCDVSYLTALVYACLCLVQLELC